MSYQKGVAPLRLEWVEETTTGVTPTDPAWNLFSDNVTNAWQWTPDANTQTQRGAGSSEAQGFYNGSESHDVTIEYDLQQWFVDGSANTVDALGDFIRPGPDNGVKATHSVVGRTDYQTGGSDNAGRRIYTVGKGGHPSSATIPFNTDDGSPIPVTAEYMFEKVRQYVISQPSASTTLSVANNGSTSVDVTIEDEGASTSETVTVAGGGSQTTTATFSDIDAVELSTDTDGTVVVSDGSGTDFVTIHGTDEYPSGEGDLGVPALGAGSHASALGSSYVRFLDDTLTIPNAPAEYEVTSGELSVDLNLDDNAKVGSARRNIHATAFDYVFTASLAGPRMSIDQNINYLTEATGTITWTAGEGSIQGNNAFITSPGEYSNESENGKIVFDNEFTAETLTIA